MIKQTGKERFYEWLPIIIIFIISCISLREKNSYIETPTGIILSFLECALIYGLYALVCIGFFRYEKLLVFPKWQAIRKLIVYVIMLLLLYLFWEVSEFKRTYRLFGLNNSNTVYDYHSSSQDKQESWDYRIWEYPNEMCVPKKLSECYWIGQDWGRNYEVNNENEYKFRDCINMRIRSEKPWTKLGDICQKCAIQPQFMKATIEPEKREMCRKIQR